MSGFAYSVLLFSAIAISSLCAGINSGIFALNKYQLKRKAQFGDKDARLVFSLYANRYQVMATLLILNILANTTIVVLINAAVNNSFFAVLFSTVLILFFGELLPMVYLKKNVVFVTARIYPVLQRLVLFSAPLTKTLGDLFDRWIGKDTQIFYTKEELLRMFDGQKLSENSDIAADEARMIRKVLNFGDQKIRDVMTPRRMAKLVSQNDTLGPQLLSELHESGHSRFPVVREPLKYNFIGTLYIRDLALEKTAKKVKDVMSKDVQYVHEEKSLDFALRTFLKTRHHLLIVVNSFEEFVGLLSIEDILEEVIGKEIIDEFDKHDDLRAVAKSLAEEDTRARNDKSHKPSKDDDKSDKEAQDVDSKETKNAEK